MMQRVTFMTLAGAALLGIARSRERLQIVTYRDSRCGCCEGWVAVARDAGNDVQLHDLPRDGRLRRFGLTQETAGCHTSLVGGYVIEGHVPLSVIATLLHSRPRVRGIALPGMPTGIAGMAGPKTQAYRIMTLEPHPRIFATV